jgi:hypothetical protein
MIGTIAADLIVVLLDAGFQNDNLPDSSPPPQTTVFRVGVSEIAPIANHMDNGDKRILEGEIIVTVLTPRSGGNPQESQLRVATVTEEILAALFKTSMLATGADVQYAGTRFSSYGNNLRSDNIFRHKYEI